MYLSHCTLHETPLSTHLGETIVGDSHNSPIVFVTMPACRKQIRGGSEKRNRKYMINTSYVRRSICWLPEDSTRRTRPMNIVLPVFILLDNRRRGFGERFVYADGAARLPHNLVDMRSIGGSYSGMPARSLSLIWNQINSIAWNQEQLKEIKNQAVRPR
jgi:hypothetical protein